MPQHLKIEVEGQQVAELRTRNKGETLYNVRLCVPELETECFHPNVNTGVQRQPQDDAGRAEDFRDDFTHARRCIAAAFATADEFLEQLGEQGAPEYTEIKPITMWLMTNDIDRGVIQIHPGDKESVNVDVVIGAGANRVPNALPKHEWKWTREGVGAPGATSQTARALTILRSLGGELLHALLRESCASRLSLLEQERQEDLPQAVVADKHNEGPFGQLVDHHDYFGLRLDPLVEHQRDPKDRQL